jgi:hypothetical protein
VDWQLGDQNAARMSYYKALAWVERNQPVDPDVILLQTEAAELLGISEAAPSTDAAPQP